MACAGEVTPNEKCAASNGWRECDNVYRFERTTLSRIEGRRECVELSPKEGADRTPHSQSRAKRA